jgi:hypothetical protein
VVGVSTDEKQNLWVATTKALYLLVPGQTSFRRFDASSGLHPQVCYHHACGSSEADLRLGDWKGLAL